MLDPETRRKVRELKVPGLLDAIDMVGGDESYASLSFEDKVKVLVDYSYQEAMNEKVERLIRQAHLRLPQADIADIDYDGRPISRDLVLELGTSQFVSTATDVILEGFTGTGNYAGSPVMLGNGP